MPRRKQTTLQQLKGALRQAQAENNAALAEELRQVLFCLQQPWEMAFRALTKMLSQSTSQVTKAYIAEAFGKARDPRVLKPLMRAATATENENYSATFLWPCAQYDCTAHVGFFVKFIVQCQDPGEAMVACIDVIEEMKGPFDAKTIERNITKLLRRKRIAIPAELQTQDEVLTIQASHALLDKYFDQVDAKWRGQLNGDASTSSA